MKETSIFLTMTLAGFHASTDDIANNKWIPSEENSNERYFNGINAGMIPMADRVWKHFPCVDKTSEDSLSIST